MDEANSLFQRFLRTYNQGDVIFSEGASGSEMYIIHSGRVKISRRNEKGRDVTFADLEPGDFFGEMAMIDGSPRSASATAEEDGTELITLDQSKFKYMLQQLPEFSLAIMQRLAERLRGMDKQLAERENGE